MSEMKKVSTNPIVNLSKDELEKFLQAIDENFVFVTIKDEVVEDWRTKWWDLYNECIKYAYWNHLEITESYPEDSERTYSDIVKIMIQDLIKLRIKDNKC
jgi:nitric oxide synthase oxygenase domain/subunit